ncbi:MAG: hypothetical protein DHS20C18_25040 [Saprospiraceae bacterium]|nr:MAG: hypothetical protein DHS20C18_25040 [Saprospiraceae bacterium]
MKNIRYALYHLIKKLSKGEKRYLQLFSKLQDGEKQYIALFEAIDKYPEKNWRPKLVETELKKDLEAIIPVKRFSTVKNYLLEQALYSLRLYHRKKSVDWQIFLKLMDREILREKGMTQLAKSRLDEARLEAQKYERHYLLLHILDLQIRYVVEQVRVDPMEELKILNSEKERIFTYLRNENHYCHINHQAFILYKMGKRTRDEESTKQIETLLNDPILHNSGKAQTFEAQINMYSARAMLHNLKEELQNANFAFKQLVKTVENYPLMQQLYSRRYFMYLNNYLQNCHRIGAYEEFPENWEKMNKIIPQNEEEEAEYSLIICETQLQYYVNKGDLKNARAVAKTISNKIEVYHNKSESFRQSRESMSRFNLTMFYFLSGEFEKARDVFNLFTSGDVPIREEIKATSRIFELICWNELNDGVDFLDYLHNSTKWQLKKKGHLHDFENKFMSLLKKIKKLTDRESIESQFQKFLKEQILELEKEGPHIPGKEEIRLWIKSKLEHKSMIKILLEEVEKVKGNLSPMVPIEEEHNIVAAQKE